MIAYKGVSKSFRDSGPAVLHNITFEVQTGETVALLGTSGSGKTTLLKLTNRLLDFDVGLIEVDGTSITDQDPISLRRRIGYVFQGIGLFPHMDVLSNVSIVLRLLARSIPEQQTRAHELLTMVGLPPEEYADRYPHELSGGQQQRVGVARALAADPEFLLMDEPFGALDALTRNILQQELLSLKQKLQKTIVFVTHDIFEALTIGDRIAVLNNGRLEQIGTKQEILRAPATPFIEELFGKPRAQLEAFGDA
ncbi:MAG: ATP-binding cassette domain-containing protein [Bacteroidota bacterium]